MLELLEKMIAGVSAGMWSQINAGIPPVPAEVHAACGQIQAATGWLRGAAWLLPMTELSVAVLIVIACVLAGWTIMVVRIVASFLTLGGGGT